MLLLTLIGSACSPSDQGMPSPVTPSTLESVTLPTTEKLGDNTPTHQAQARPATPSPTQDNTSINPDGKYLFIEFWNHETGTGNLPFSAIDFPHYYFDSANGALKLNLSDSIMLSPTDLGFIGQGTSLSEAAGMGAASGLTVIDHLPFSIEVYLYTRQVDQPAGSSMDATREVTLTVLSAAEDGSILIDLDGQMITLVPGQDWKQTIQTDYMKGQYNGHLILTSTMTNYGWQDRAKINKQ